MAPEKAHRATWARGHRDLLGIDEDFDVLLETRVLDLFIPPLGPGTSVGSRVSHLFQCPATVPPAKAAGSPTCRSASVSIPWGTAKALSVSREKSDHVSSSG